jgi:site-specific DNA-methyltransferase (adenine-specific)
VAATTYNWTCAIDFTQVPGGGNDNSSKRVYGGNIGKGTKGFRLGDSGSVARFFYTTKASRAERGEDNTHPTVKPIAIMEWVTKLVCPPGGTVLDPFIGSGTTALAAISTGRQCIGIERDSGYFDIACRRVTEALDKTALFTPTT